MYGIANEELLLLVVAGLSSLALFVAGFGPGLALFVGGPAGQPASDYGLRQEESWSSSWPLSSAQRRMARGRRGT